jgi:hypothetical protein
MLTGITARASTPQEDAEPWPGGSARAVLAYLTGTLGMTGADARELLTAARMAGTGPGALADYPVPDGDAHLLIHYAPGSRAYRFKLTTPDNEIPPGGGPAGDAGGTPAPGLPAPPGGAAQSGTAGTTVTIWHNVAFDGQGRHTAMLGGYQPGDPVVRVFAYRTDPGRPADEVADEAFDIFTGHPRDAADADLACAYDQRRLRPLAAGDVVAAGDVLLAVARPAGWTLVTGPLTEVRTSEHGTRPLPGGSRPFDAAGDAAGPCADEGGS